MRIVQTRNRAISEWEKAQDKLPFNSTMRKTLFDRLATGQIFKSPKELCDGIGAKNPAAFVFTAEKTWAKYGLKLHRDRKRGVWLTVAAK